MKTILLCDPNPSFREPAAAALRARQFDVVVADDIYGAKRALSHIAVDVAVCCEFSDHQANEFAEAIRSCHRPIRVVWVAASNVDVDQYGKIVRQLEGSLVWQMPMAVDDLAARISALVEHATPTSTSPNLSKYAVELEMLRQTFAAKLPQKLLDLQEAITLAKTEPAYYEDAKVLAHRLRGSAGSYGYAELGEAVGTVEDLLAEQISTKGVDVDQCWKKMEDAMKRSRTFLEKAPDQDLNSLELLAANQRAMLVVDDDIAFLEAVNDFGRKSLLNIFAASTPADALRVAQSTPLFGVVLNLDVNNEVSFELARAIRDSKDNAQVPIAFASADRNIATRIAANEAGGMRFFEKPFSTENFALLVEQFTRISESLEGRILIVDDDPDVAQHYSLHLRAAGMRVETLPSAETIVEKLEQFRPDVLLLDVSMPRISGLDVCRALRMSPPFDLLPILIVSGLTDDRTRLAAFRAGASDVVCKPVTPEELYARVKTQLERLRLLRERADKDVLSGLLLRRALLEAFQRSLSFSSRERKPLAMVLFDIDSFKKINDEHGHLVGDTVIARLGELLRRRFRLEDLRGRWGGEEFILVFPGQTAEFAERAAQSLLSEFEKLQFVNDGGQPFHATMTAGVAAFPEDGTTISALVRKADELLYFGKLRGKNQVHRSNNRPIRPDDSGIRNRVPGKEQRT